MTPDKLLNQGKYIWDRAEITRFLEGHTSSLEVEPYQYYGLNELTVYRSGDFITLNVVVNLQSLTEQLNTLRLYDCTPDLICRLSEQFRTTLGAIGFTNFRSISEWFPQRIDFAIDVVTDHVAEYVALAKMEKRPARFVDLVNKEGSIYPECSSVTLNFYDKADQVRKELSDVPDYRRLCADAQRIFRLEVQCKSVKLKGLWRKYNLPNLQLGNFMNPRIALDVVVSYYTKVMGIQGFYSMAAAQTRVTHYNRCGAARKSKFIEWLNYISHVGTLPLAKAAYLADGGTKSTFDRYLKLSRDIGINPITIPDEWGISTLPNPLPEQYHFC